MHRLAVIFLLFLAASCNSNQENEPTAKAEQWVLAETKRYDYKLNPLGKSDTTFIYTYQYMNGNITDSSTNFSVSKYKGDFLSNKTYYRLGEDKKPIEEFSINYEFAKNGKMKVSTLYNSGKLLKDERYNYNDSNLLTKYTLVQSKSLSPLPEDFRTGARTASFNPNPGYDTLVGIYKYDNTNKVVGTSYFNNYGKHLRTDVNLYSGSTPLSSHTTDYKGDTLQKTMYEVQEKTLRSRIENDSFVLYQNLLNGVQIGQLINYKTKKEKWRTSSTFDQKGRKVEDKLYKAM